MRGETIRDELKKRLDGASPAALVEELFAFLTQRGDSKYDECVTQLEHALQCAELARERSFSNQAVTSSLFHDIGHLLAAEDDSQPDFRQQDMSHEEVGAAFLAEWFPPEVTDPIGLHVAAKRYLCTTDATYYEQLSAASKRSFKLQGGPLSAAERNELEQNAHLQLALDLRRLDDLAKVEGKDLPAIEDFAQTVASCLRPERSP